MKKRNIRNLLIVSLFLVFSTSLATLAISDLHLSTSDNITDSADDVIIVDMNKRNWKSTDLHSEVDIHTMIRSDQNFTITFHETIQTGTNYQYSFGIYEEFGDEETYSVMFISGMKGYLLGPEGYWTTTGWSYTSLNQVTVGTISGDKIEIGIPSAALIIDNSLNWGFIAGFVDNSANKTYADFCPDQLRKEVLKEYSGPSNPIFGYELSVLIGFTAIVTIIFIYMYKKQLKSGF